MRRKMALLAATALMGGVLVGTGTAAAGPLEIGGPTAQDWVDAGAAVGIGVTLVATPANEPPVTYDGSTATAAVFDATERDDYFCQWNASGTPLCPQTYGIGVGNTLISFPSPGVTSPPAEIGYYGNAAICGAGLALDENCGDTLSVQLDKAVSGGSFSASFFYGSEDGSREKVSVEFFREGVSLGASQTVEADVLNAPTTTNEGKSTHALASPDGACWDEIVFSAAPAAVADASDLLVEGLADLTICPDIGGDTATGSGTAISERGNWFMYNTYPGGVNDCYVLQAGNPVNGSNPVGEYCIADNSDGTFTATYDFDDTITVGGYVYNIVVDKEHLAISDAADFTGKPGRDDNQDFGVPFDDIDGEFFVFAHFSISYEVVGPV